ncbi:MAG: Fe-S cluster assembly protein SufD [Thiobacillus sp.]|nr:Fe-S cluster assembly protein SufD [Thiobacillus sp.]
MNLETATRYRQALDYISSAVGHVDARQRALERFLASGLPTPRLEDWKYTALDALERSPWHAPEHARDALPDSGDTPGTRVAFGNGRLVHTGGQPQREHSLAAHVDDARARQVFDSLAGDAALTQINRALWQDGLWLHVPAGQVAPPVFAVHYASEADAMLHTRNLVVLEAGAQAVLVEHYRGVPDRAYWQNPVTEIVLGEGAHLDHLTLTEEGAAASHTGLAVVRQARHSRYSALSVNIGGRLVRHETRVNLDGPHAECRLDGLFIADTRRHIDQHLHVEHAAPRTTSRQTWRGIAAGRGRGIFDARVVVHAGAQQADAQQSSRNLLLSPHAEIDVKPQLEIHADDVKCGHGATVGQLDEAQVFYLRSRGIDAVTARALLLRAFAEEALGWLKNSGLAGWLEPHLAAALRLQEGERTA